MSLDFEIIRKCRNCGANVQYLDECGEGPFNQIEDSYNITHNLGEMAEAVGIYKCLWRPKENGFKTAGDVIPVLEKGLKKLKAFPAKYKKYDSPNGWGLYKNFVPFCEKVLKACKKFPENEINADC